LRQVIVQFRVVWVLRNGPLEIGDCLIVFQIIKMGVPRFNEGLLRF
jgi:hypothetical protein